jgi:1,4-alpha-glucan branching enzyme
MYPYQHDAESKMTEFANKFDNPNELENRALNQLARELLLAQSSDWAFQIYQGTTVQYASRRFQSHIHRFNLITEMLETQQFNEELLTEIESRDNIFAEIDYRVYKS